MGIVEKMTKGEERPSWLIIDDYKYDIKEFSKRHPGGSVIQFYYGMDATDAFYAFHQRSEKAKKWLSTLPREKIPADTSLPLDGRDPLVQDFRKLRQRLIDEGYFKPLWTIQFLRCFEYFFVAALSYWLTYSGHWILGGIVAGFGIGRNGLLMHDMGHRAFAGDMTRDRALHLIFFNFMAGGSATFWVNQHSKHHAATQEIGHDTDLDTLPLIAFNHITASKGSADILKYQYLTFLPAQLLLFFLWKFTHARHAIRTKNYPEVVALIAHHLVEIYLLYVQGVLAILTHLSLSFALGGFYLATIFSVNHTHKPVVDKYSTRDWVRRAALYTTNTTPWWFCTWFTGYLNYQIEHHLFPQIPHPQLPYVAPLVQELFAKHGIEYDMRDLSTAFYAVFRNLYDIATTAAKTKKVD